MSAAEVASILARLEAKTVQMEKAGIAGLEQVGRDVARAASDLAPVEATRDRGDHPAGALRDSLLGGENGIGEGGIRLDHDKNGHPEVIVGTRLVYAAKVEFDDAAYLRPALHAAEAGAHDTIASHVRPVVGF